MLINEGTYDARITDATLTEKGEEKKPVIELTIEVTGNGLESPVTLSKTYWFGEEPDQYNEGKREWQVSVERLRELGFVGDDISDLSAVVGFVGRCGVKNKTGTSGAYSVVSWVGKGGAKPMAQAKAASFAEQMKAKIRALSDAKPAQPAAQAAARPAQAAQRTQPRPAQRPAQKPAPEPDFNEPDTSDVPF